MKERWLWAFPAVGIVFLTAAAVLQVHRWNEEQRMLPTSGTVVELLGRRGCPLVEFSTPSGERASFVGEVCSNSGYDVGERVALMYDPLEPGNAHIDGFLQNWFISLIFGFFGVFFTGIGLAFVLPNTFAERRRQRLMKEGQAVQARFIEVRRNEFSTLNGVAAWQLVGQWQNPDSGAVHLFYSDDLWFDPLPFIKSQTLRVLIDPKDSRRYSVDTSFLPQLAG
ncbi:DUF3592 domain-containing protein [Pseudomonas sp.]|uniref:DUF3592 domain-containing protein n=1 Tax=Pseudomonas sp. TaxID=306 RepID=UPI003D0FBC4A